MKLGILDHEDHATIIVDEQAKSERSRLVGDMVWERLRLFNRRATWREALRTIRGNRFEALKGDRVGQYSIRINDRYRLCFEWPANEGHPFNIEIVDYHG